MPSVLSPAKTRTTVVLREFGIELHDKMSTARQALKWAQKRQEDHYDRSTTTLLFFTKENGFFCTNPWRKQERLGSWPEPSMGPIGCGRWVITQPLLFGWIDRCEEIP